VTGVIELKLFSMHLTLMMLIDWFELKLNSKMQHLIVIVIIKDLTPLNVQTPEEFMIQEKNFESSGESMAHHRKKNGPNKWKGARQTILTQNERCLALYFMYIL
jgi:hypothetical protein